MNRNEGRREIIFQMTMAAARKMMEQGIASKDSYQRFEELMRQKYSPVFGGLFYHADLI